MLDVIFKSPERLLSYQGSDAINVRYAIGYKLGKPALTMYLMMSW